MPKKLTAKIREMSPEEKEQLIKEVGQAAYDNLASMGMGCAQSTLAALQQYLSLKGLAVFKAASGLTAGIGRSGEGACAALTVGAMAIGLVYGRDKMEPASTAASRYEETMKRSGILCDKFEEQFDSLKCHDVQRKLFGRSWNMRDPEEFAEFGQVLQDTRASTCGNVVRKSAEFAAEIILEPTEPK